MKNDLEIAKNIREIESLKVEMLGKLYNLLKSFIDEAEEDAILDGVVDIIIYAYLLGDKVGYRFKEIDEALIKKLRSLIVDKNIDMEYNFSELLKHLKTQKRE
ncbi:MazG-like family protein [Caldanaerobacter sp.]|uniref:MazG-like family protein n=1 Tax=Caldanaerobacter sp. TaxID=2930036 RepID=UPI003C72D1BE